MGWGFKLETPRLQVEGEGADGYNRKAAKSEASRGAKAEFRSPGAEHESASLAVSTTPNDQNMEAWPHALNSEAFCK